MTDQTEIDELLDRWEDARERGKEIDLDDLCRDHPSLRPQVERQIQALQAMEQHLEPEKVAAAQAVGLGISFDSDVASLQFHAKGGLGAVYVGQDSRLNRQVAIKFIHPSLTRDKLSVERFELEAEITGRLEHPGVIPVYGIGQSTDGRPFYAMRFIDGKTMDDGIKDYRASRGIRNAEAAVGFRNLLQSFVSICKTVAYAHNRGIVHRDIKPDNVLLGRYGEAIVVDWGLACPIARDEHHRQSGEQTLMPKSSGSGSSSGNGAGTPAYMSPEQASGLTPTPSSDIYSLGATLFKILTGQAPITGITLQEIKTNVIEGRIPKPSDVDRQVPKPLDAICRKAMALRPNDRYQTALELAEDVERFLADEAVDAYEESSAARAGRWLRHNRGVAIATFTGLAACLILAGLSSLWLAHSAQSEATARRDAQAAQQLAEASRRDNLGTSALFLARSIAQEMDLRWRVLEAEGASPRLRELIEEVNASLTENGSIETSELQPLQSWLEKRYIANHNAFKAVCWCINAVDGTQVARVPEAGSIGRNFRHRDYFHGEGRDLRPAEVESRQQILPLADKDAYVSAVFQGTNTRTLMVTFCVPIWSGPPEDQDRQRIGVFAVPVELGDFGLGAHAILADSREDQLNQRAGLILHHPQSGLLSRSDELPYLEKPDLERAITLRKDRISASRLARFDRLSVTDSFVDPMSHDTRLAAIEPVIIPGRDNPLADTGWIVIVTEDDDYESHAF